VKGSAVASLSRQGPATKSNGNQKGKVIMADERALTIGVSDGEELDAVSRGLFSKAYTQLSDAEAAQVRAAIEAADEAAGTEAGQ
jgi:hypothetical protein